MRTIVLHGSPRKNGDSDTLAEHFLRGLRENGDPEVRHFYTNEMSIKPCQGCLGCARAEDRRCVVKDDMQEIYSAFMEADLIVWATPMYWGYMTAQLKAALDRMEALVMWDHWRGKKFVVLITYHYHCESTVAFFERVCPFFEVTLRVITCRTLDVETDTHVPITGRQDKLDEAYVLGREIGPNDE